MQGQYFCPQTSVNAALHLPRPTMSLIYIDDQDFTKVTYKGSWVRGGIAAEYDSTIASSTVVGDSFTVSFQGEGVGEHALE
jgi:hypothetical protein